MIMTRGISLPLLRFVAKCNSYSLRVDMLRNKSNAFFNRGIFHRDEIMLLAVR